MRLTGSEGKVDLSKETCKLIPKDARRILRKKKTSKSRL